MTAAFDFAAHYKVVGGAGIAWRALRHPAIRDEDYEWSGIEDHDRERVVMVMVGDDREETFGLDEVEVIPEESFCRGCGQVGCGHEVWS